MEREAWVNGYPVIPTSDRETWANGAPVIPTEMESPAAFVPKVIWFMAVVFGLFL